MPFGPIILIAVSGGSNRGFLVAVLALCFWCFSALSTLLISEAVCLLFARLEGSPEPKTKIDVLSGLFPVVLADRRDESRHRTREVFSCSASFSELICWFFVGVVPFGLVRLFVESSSDTSGWVAMGIVCRDCVVGSGEVSGGRLLRCCLGIVIGACRDEGGKGAAGTPFAGGVGSPFDLLPRLYIVVLLC